MSKRRKTTAPALPDGTLCSDPNKPASCQYNFVKNTCDRCGISKEDAKKRPPTPTGVNHPEYAFTTSFQLSLGGGVLCASCSRELELENLFILMDKKGK